MKLKQTIFIISPPSSGSTLLRNMLNGHSKICAPPEFYLLQFDDLESRASDFKDKDYLLKGLAQTLEELMNISREEAHAIINQFIEQKATPFEIFAFIQSLVPDRILVDKTPSNGADLTNFLLAQKWFEDPIFIHIHRHPYSAVDSLMRRTYQQAKNPKPVDGKTPEPKELTTEDIANAQKGWEAAWCNPHMNALMFQEDNPDAKYCRLSYENLTAHPEEMMREVCEFLGFDYEPTMADPYTHKPEKIETITPNTELFPLGDPGFYKHKAVDKNLGEKWKRTKLPNPLQEETILLARMLGYELPVEMPESEAIPS